MKGPKITCKCDKCHKRQVVAVDDYLTDPRCRLHGLRKQCPGNLAVFSDDTIEAIQNAVSVLHHISTKEKLPDKLGILVDAVSEDVWVWSENEQTPRAMGWVGQNGLP